jgi:hypothetical protein
MPHLKDFLQIQTRTGEPLTSGGLVVRPQSQALVVRWPFGGFVWNRPIAVLVEHDGYTQRIPIIDRTRVITWTLYGLAAALSVIMNMLAARRRRQHERSA